MDFMAACMLKQMPAAEHGYTTAPFSGLTDTQHNNESSVSPPQVQCSAGQSLIVGGMRMLGGSLAGGGVDKGSAAPGTPLPASQGQLTPEGRRISATTGFFDAHTGLVLAALLCALVGALGLHSLLRCALHHCGRRGRSALPPAGAGLKKSALRRMPVAVYEAPGAPAAGAECAICLGEFEDGEAVRLLPRCRHGFHVHCIDTWLSAHSSCPICRDSLHDDDEGASATAAAGEETAAWMSPSFTAAMLILA